MGNTIMKHDSHEAHNDIVKSPLYSDGTTEMKTRETMGAIDEPTKPPHAVTKYATIHEFKED